MFGCGSWESALALVLIGIVFGLLSHFLLRCFTRPHPKIVRTQQETTFLDPQTGKCLPFPDLIENRSYQTTKLFESVYLSVIIPAYNEDERLPIMLEETMDYLLARASKDRQFSYEVLIVDDGSRDGTSEIALDHSKRYGAEHVRLLKLSKNHGKGGAVRLGVLSSRGERILFADADGATQFVDFERLEDHINQAVCPELAVAIGSRAHLEKDSIASRSMFRTILMYGFHFVVWFFTVRSVKDTQCGFKLFGRKAAILLFNSIHVEGWAFDVELLYLCECFGLEMAEIAVNWQEIEGSKIVPVFSWLAMGRDVLTISIMYATGAWKLPDKQALKKNN